MRRLLIFACLALAPQALSLASEITTASPEVTTAHSILSAYEMSQHKPMDWSLLQSGPGLKSTSEAPVPSDAPEAQPSSLKKHTLMGWSLPELGSGLRPTNEATAETITTPKISLFSQSEPDLPGAGIRSTRNAAQLSSRTSLSPAQILKNLEHTRTDRVLTMPGSKRIERAAPRALPAHKAHGPRSPYPIIYGPRKTEFRAVN